jgi:hypothetical protein
MATNDQDAIGRAKADIAEFDRKINVIRNEEARLESQRRQMESERDRIQAFVEMYERYAGSGSTQTNEPTEDVPAVRSMKRVRLRFLDRKPKDIPPMTEMIVAAIKSNGRGLEPREMTEFIRDKWWPHVKGESVGPIAWRMSRAGQLRKEGSFYMLPRADANAA